MNKLIVLFITAIVALFLTGCWGTATENGNLETANANLQPNANSPTVGNYDINTVNDPPESGSEGNQKPTLEIQTNKVGNHVKTGKPGVEPDAMKKAEAAGQYLLAPENSYISNEMNKQGNPVQTRKFKDNPTLDKVEIITFGEKQIKQLVHLKNGKVLELQNGKVEDPMTASSIDLLKAVGIEAKTPARTDGKDEQKNR